MNKIFTLLSTGLVSIGAQAYVVSYADAITGSLTDWSGTLTLPKFSGGILDSVVFTYDATVTWSFAAENLGSRTKIITETATATIDYGAPAAQTLTATKTESQSVAAHSSFLPTNPIEVVMPLHQTLTLTTGLGQYVGVGNYDVPVSASSLTSVTGPGNMFADIETMADAKISVDYVYRAPEPGSLALVGLAIGALGLSLRRRLL